MYQQRSEYILNATVDEQFEIRKPTPYFSFKKPLVGKSYANNSFGFDVVYSNIFSAAFDVRLKSYAASLVELKRRKRNVL